VDQLGELLGPLSNDSQLIIAGLDELLARAWRQLAVIRSDYIAPSLAT